jgi:hypothetical protein
MGFHTPQQCECGGWARETRWSPSPAAALHLDVEPEFDHVTVNASSKPMIKTVNGVITSSRWP